jgi:hypothetical protein
MIAKSNGTPEGATYIRRPHEMKVLAHTWGDLASLSKEGRTSEVRSEESAEVIVSGAKESTLRRTESKKGKTDRDRKC